jgi:hypothetical protein
MREICIIQKLQVPFHDIGHVQKDLYGSQLGSQWPKIALSATCYTAGQISAETMGHGED